jgi:hypothetical protein
MTLVSDGCAPHIVRALVERAAQEWRDGIAAPRLAAWKASQSGVEETLLHPLLNMPCPAADVVRAFLGHIRPALASSGDEEQVILEFARIITSGTGSHWQRETMLSTQRLTAGVEPPSWSRRRGSLPGRVPRSAQGQLHDLVDAVGSDSADLRRRVGFPVINDVIGAGGRDQRSLRRSAHGRVALIDIELLPIIYNFLRERD